MGNLINIKSKKTAVNWSTTISVAIIGLLFFIFGFTTWINAILIPYFKIACELNYVQSLLVAFAFYIPYILGITMSGFLLGMVLIPRYINHLNVLKFCTTSAIVLTLFFFLVRGQVTFLGHTANLSIWFLVLLGLSNSLMWSAIWPLALNGLSRFTKMGGSLLIMGLCGSAIIPIFYGYFADHFNPHLAYLVHFPCYLYLVYYAYYGYRVKNWSLKKIDIS